MNDDKSRQQLDGFDLDTLENDSSCIYALTRGLTLSYMNPAWYAFARKNGGQAVINERYRIGAYIADAFGEPFKSYYVDLYQRLLESGDIWQHEYECSSEVIYRMYQQTIYPLRDLSGLLVVNSLRIEQSADAGENAAILSAYTEPTGLTTKCVHCRRLRRVSKAPIWDSLAPAKTTALNVSHSLCPICYDYFYSHLHQAGGVCP
jgi:hypothetical protein